MENKMETKTIQGLYRDNGNKKETIIICTIVG